MFFRLPPCLLGFRNLLLDQTLAGLGHLAERWPDPLGQDRQHDQEDRHLDQEAGVDIEQAGLGEVHGYLTAAATLTMK